MYREKEIGEDNFGFTIDWEETHEIVMCYFRPQKNEADVQIRKEEADGTSR